MLTAPKWQYVAHVGTPSDARTVHIAVRGDTEIGQGWWEGDRWRDCVDANDLGDSVYAWAELMAVPPELPVEALAA